MKKLILPIILSLLMLFPVGIFAQTDKVDQTELEPGSKLTCDQVWKIAGSENCERFVVSNDAGGLWCNLPDTRESLQPWIYGPAPTYTFTPGTCSVESETPQSQQPQSDQLEQSNSSADNSKKGTQQTGPSGLTAITGNVIDIVRAKLTVAGPGLPSPSNVTERIVGEYVFKNTQGYSIPQPKISVDSEGKPVFVGEYSHYGSKVQYQDNWRRLQTEKIISVTEPTLFELTDNRTLIGLSPGQGNQVAVKIPKDGKSYLLFLEEGEIEIVKNKPGVSDSDYDGIKTPNATVVSVQTHYLVRFDKKTNETTVAVYKGKVEVKTNDGKTASVSPNGDKPGAVVVSQKLSPVRLALVGLVLAAALGGAFMILRRKFALKVSNKKKK